jgi:adenosine deaminase
MLNAAILAALPKVELHCHLDGILDPEILAEMQLAGVGVGLSVEELRSRTPAQSYDEFMRWAQGHDRIEGDIDNFRIVVARHIERLRAQRVVYTEIAIGSSEIPVDHSEMIDKLAAFRAFIDEQECGETQVELLVALNRKKPPTLVDAIVGRALVLHREGLVAGFALAGIEQGNPVRPLMRTFARLHDEGVGVEIHAREWAGADAVRDALDYGRPHRIGHGVAAFGDVALLHDVVERGIHVELCPTSNVCTGAVESLAAHPLRQARNSGVSFSINSDDPGSFACDLAGEYALAAREFGYSEKDLIEVSRSALRARFQPRLRGWAAEFAAANGIA